MSETPVTNLRRADFWTSLVLLGVAAVMLGKTLGMPLTGTYAGVQNAWYVSPALFPLIVATSLLVLGTVLLLNAIRSGGAHAAWQSVRNPQVERFIRTTGESWVIVAVLSGYIYALVPRIDFVAATVLTLFTLVAVFDLGSLKGARAALAIFGAAVLSIAAMALVGIDLAPRSAAAYGRDTAVWGAALLSILIVSQIARADAGSRSRLARCIWVSVLTPLILGVIFKYGLLVPLPNEGVTVELLDRVRYGVPNLLSR